MLGMMTQAAAQAIYIPLFAKREKWGTRGMDEWALCVGHPPGTMTLACNGQGPLSCTVNIKD